MKEEAEGGSKTDWREEHTSIHVEEGQGKDEFQQKYQNNIFWLYYGSYLAN